MLFVRILLGLCLAYKRIKCMLLFGNLLDDPRIFQYYLESSYEPNAKILIIFLLKLKPQYDYIYLINSIQKYTRLYTRYNLKNNQIKGRNAITLSSRTMPANNKQSVINLQKLDLLIYKANATENFTQDTSLLDAPSIKI